MEQIIKKVLKKIESNGYEAYLVGGYVRDVVLARKSFDIDICTNALPKDLNKIFPNCQNNNYGGINFRIKRFNFDITTYRKEKKYESRKPVEIEYINNLIEDINRRDFTINALCMNSKGYIIDLINGMEDIKSKTINVIGNCAIKFKEDPLRMLRAIRFMTVLDFKLSDEVLLQIKQNVELIKTLSYNRIKEELDKILLSPNFKKGIMILEELGILNLLNIKNQNIVYVNDLLGMWAQFDFGFNSAFTKEEKNNIINIRKIIRLNKIDEKVLFNYGLYLSLVAGKIIGVNKVYINKLYKQMPIYNKQDVAINNQDIMDILNIEPSEILNVIMQDIIDDILAKTIKNNYQDIKRYLLRKKETWIK